MVDFPHSGRKRPARPWTRHHARHNAAGLSQRNDSAASSLLGSCRGLRPLQAVLCQQTMSKGGRKPAPRGCLAPGGGATATPLVLAPAAGGDTDLARPPGVLCSVLPCVLRAVLRVAGGRVTQEFGYMVVVALGQYSFLARAPPPLTGWPGWGGPSAAFPAPGRPVAGPGQEATRAPVRSRCDTFFALPHVAQKKCHNGATTSCDRGT